MSYIVLSQIASVCTTIFNHLCRLTEKEISKFCISGIFGSPPIDSPQMVSYVESIFMSKFKINYPSASEVTPQDMVKTDQY